MIQFLKPCIQKIQEFPEETREDLLDAVARLEEGHHLSFPMTRPMPSRGSGVHELRFRDREGIYRVI